MTQSRYNNNAPGLGPTREAVYRLVTLGHEKYLPGLHIIDGSKARDPLNDPIAELRAGVLLGRVTSSSKLALSIIGTLSSSVSSTDTTLTIGTAAATEVQRRTGTGSGADVTITGPASASGTVNQETKQVSSIDTGAGTITLNSGLSNGYIQGAFVGPSDGSETPITFLPSGYPLDVLDGNQNNQDVQTNVLIAGLVDASQIINWPSNSVLQDWIIGKLNVSGGGQFTFDNKYGL